MDSWKRRADLLESWCDDATAGAMTWRDAEAMIWVMDRTLCYEMRMDLQSGQLIGSLS